MLYKEDRRVRSWSWLWHLLEQFRLKGRNTPKLFFFFQSWNNNSKKGIEHKSHLDTMMDNALFTIKREQVSQIFSQIMSQSLSSWSELYFSDLSLKGAKPKIPASNARILGHSRFSYNLNLVSQYKMWAYRQGKHPLNWLLCSPIPMNTKNIMKARDVCVYVYLRVYTSSQPAELFTLYRISKPTNQILFFCWVL